MSGSAGAGTPPLESELSAVESKKAQLLPTLPHATPGPTGFSEGQDSVSTGQGQHQEPSLVPEMA